MKVQKNKMTKQSSFLNRAKKDLKMNYSLYLLVLPVVAYYIIFCYVPMYGITIAFKDYNIRQGIFGSEWIGFENFIRFFNDPYFGRNIINTIRISFASILFGFPAPIILALLMNEINNKFFKKTVQTITYLPHFVSLVVICGMISSFVSVDGLITNLISAVTGVEFKESLLNNENLFTGIYVISDIWQEVGWGTIIYLAALAGVDHELYEASEIDGAGRLRQVISITLPSILPTIIIMLILRLGSVLSVGYEKIMLLTNSFNAQKSEVLSYYVYKKGLINSDYGLSTAAGLFNSVINLIFVFATNYISGRLTETSLW